MAELRREEIKEEIDDDVPEWPMTMKETDIRSQAREIRRTGKSLADIAKQLAVSRSSIFRWTRDIDLTMEQRSKLMSRPLTKKLKGTISKKRKEMGEDKWNKYQQHKQKIKNIKWRLSNPEKYVNREIKIKEKLVEYKGGKCEICGYSKCLGALTFHHLDPLQKEFTIGRYHCSWDKMIEEVDKCNLLCNRCHAEIHWEEYVNRRKNRIAQIRAGARVV